MVHLPAIHARPIEDAAAVFVSLPGCGRWGLPTPGLRTNGISCAASQAAALVRHHVAAPEPSGVARHEGETESVGSQGSIDALVNTETGAISYWSERHGRMGRGVRWCSRVGA